MGSQVSKGGRTDHPADETLSAGEYEKAQELYLTAGEMSQKAGNVGKDYIGSQLDRAKAYIEVYDLIALGERKEEYGKSGGRCRSL